MILQSIARIVAIAASLALASVGLSAQNAPPEKAKGRPQLAVRSSPAVVFAPGRVVATAEFTGGADDYEEYYCGKIEWDWADGSTSAAEYDCDPYEAGKSQIRRRYTQEHTYRQPGNFEVLFRLKQGTKVVVTGRVTVEVRGDQMFPSTGWPTGAPVPSGF
jgi:hypothetical protein